MRPETFDEEIQRQVLEHESKVEQEATDNFARAVEFESENATFKFDPSLLDDFPFSDSKLFPDVTASFKKTFLAYLVINLGNRWNTCSDMGISLNKIKQVIDEDVDFKKSTYMIDRFLKDSVKQRMLQDALDSGNTKDMIKWMEMTEKELSGDSKVRDDVFHADRGLKSLSESNEDEVEEYYEIDI